MRQGDWRSGCAAKGRSSRCALDMMKGKTAVAIAQIDRTIVMENGREIEDGRHGSLLVKDGHSATFWAPKSGGFLGQT